MPVKLDLTILSFTSVQIFELQVLPEEENEDPHGVQFWPSSGELEGKTAGLPLK